LVSSDSKSPLDSTLKNTVRNMFVNNRFFTNETSTKTTFDFHKTDDFFPIKVSPE
jgi:hypothetical protein